MFRFDYNPDKEATDTKDFNRTFAERNNEFLKVLYLILGKEGGPRVD